ncbi:MAG: glycosyltransferase family 2 protein [Brevinematia bacterium]
MKTISVCIPVRNPDENLKLLIEQLFLQKADIGEILIADSSDRDVFLDDNFKEKIKIYRIEKEDFDHGGTRTFLAKNAGGDILVFLTQDVIMESERSISNLTQYFEKMDELAAVYGKQLPHKNADIFSIHSRFFIYPEETRFYSRADLDKYGFKAGFLSNAFASYRKDYLEKINYFKDKIICSEDNYAGIKFLLAGYKIGYISTAMVYHSHNFTISSEFKRYFDIGAFYSTESELIGKFKGPSYEGLRYFFSEVKFLFKNRKPFLIFQSVLRCFLKLIAFYLGRLNRFLPKGIKIKISNNKNFWENFI